jgi:phasin family protein
MAVKRKKAAAAAPRAKENGTNANGKEQAGGRNGSAAPLFGAYGDLATLGRRNIETAAHANAAFAKGLERLGKELVNATQASMENAALAARAYLGATTLQDVIAINGDYAKAEFEGFLARSAKIGETSLSVVNETLEPLTQRIEVEIGQFTNPPAA